jgi:inorganic phosphate transporter, PiT family
MLVLLALCALFVAYANGANDDFKGVATLYGGKVLSYRNALLWGVLATTAGSMISLIYGAKLLKLFSGKGLVADATLANPAFLTSVALGAALTVILATFLGLPVSTTHGLLGALIGAGIASGSLLSASALGNLFVLPLLAGPLIALSLTWGLYRLCHSVRKKLGIEATFCLCVGGQQEAVIGTPGLYTVRASGMQVILEEEQYCRNVYAGTIAGINVQRIMDSFHGITAGAVSFARGLNDTPKIAALFLLVPFLSSHAVILFVAFVMAIGGFLHSRKIAERMGFEITDLNPGQACTGNLVTAFLVVAGSLWGFPLSTTHVSCGSLFGIGAATRQAKVRAITQILTLWVATLPLAALLSAAIWLVISGKK